MAGNSIDDAEVRLRRFPCPYRAMLAICSDIDQTRIDTFRETHRFLNTLEETSMGRGVGLDIANSCWMYKAPFPGNMLRDSMSYFAGYSWETPSSYAAEMIEYLKRGWIDTLHSYGNFNYQGDKTVAFTREHALRALEVLEAHQIRIRVWVNHGDRNNRQNIGIHDFMEGDRPETAAYHADLLHRHGCEYLWRSGQSFWRAAPSVLVKFPLADGSQMFGFRRYQLRANLPEAPTVGPLYDLNHGCDKKGIPWLQVWRPQGLSRQLDESVLRSIVEDGHMSMLGQHLGSMLPLVGFDREMVGAFRRLRRYQDDGLILVARTSRLLHYNRVRDHLRFVVRSLPDRRIIDIRAVIDPVRQRWIPAVADLRGITFEVPAGPPAELWLAGKPIDPAEIVEERHAAGGRTVSVRWFEPDLTDYAQPHLEKLQSAYVLWNKRANEALAAKDAALRQFLETEQDNVPADIDPAKYAFAVRHGKERLERGLSRCVQVFEQLGFVEVRRGLDLGCGAGQWCLAFLEHSREVIGIDARPEFIALSQRSADRLGLRARARFAGVPAGEIEYKEDTFDCVWSQARLMFAEAEPVIERVARALTVGGSFYCTYTNAGGRLRIIHDGLTSGRDDAVPAQIGILLAGYLHRSGVFHTAGSRVRMLDLDDLLRVCRAFGLHYVGQPDLKEGPGPYLGVPGTFDFVVRKRRPHDAARLHLVEQAATATNWLEDLEEISRAGCPGMVCDVLRTAEPDLGDPARRDLYARSLIRAGRARGEEAARLFEQSPEGARLPDLTMGLYRHDQGKTAEALAHYRHLAPAHPDRRFLIGCCELQARDWPAAAQRFASAIAAGSREVRDYVGWIAAHHYAGDHAAALSAARALAESRAAA